MRICIGLAHFFIGGEPRIFLFTAVIFAVPFLVILDFRILEQRHLYGSFARKLGHPDTHLTYRCCAVPNLGKQASCLIQNKSRNIRRLSELTLLLGDAEIRELDEHRHTCALEILLS